MLSQPSSKEICAGNFEKEFEMNKFLKVKVFGFKTKKTVHFGTLKVVANYSLSEAFKIEYVRLYHNHNLIAEGEISSKGKSIIKNFSIFKLGVKWKATGVVKYYPVGNCVGVQVNIEGAGNRFEVVNVPLR